MTLASKTDYLTEEEVLSLNQFMAKERFLDFLITRRKKLISELNTIEKLIDALQNLYR